MKPRDFLNFFKTKSGKLVAFVALFAAALIIFSVVRKHHPSAEDAVSVTALATNATDKPQVVQSVMRPMQAFYPPPPKPEPTNLPSSSSSSSPGFSETIAVASRSRESSANARAHQSVCRQFGGNSAGQKVERGVCPVRTADSLRDGHHGGFVFHPDAHRRPRHREHILWWQIGDPGRHGDSWDGPNRPST